MPRSSSNTAEAAPFLKWAGGKTQLLGQLDPLLPDGLGSGGIAHYVEPFLGGGAMFFHLVRTRGPLDAQLYDLNAELVLVYRVVQRRIDDLLDALDALAGHHLARDEPGRRAHYYEVRTRWNEGPTPEGTVRRLGAAHVRRAAELLFLNKTCYNGLFRLNSKGHFNVPFGRYRNPCICDPARLRASAEALQGARAEKMHDHERREADGEQHEEEFRAKRHDVIASGRMQDGRLPDGSERPWWTRVYASRRLCKTTRH